MNDAPRILDYTVTLLMPDGTTKTCTRPEGVPGGTCRASNRPLLGGTYWLRVGVDPGPAALDAD